MLAGVVCCVAAGRTGSGDLMAGLSGDTVTDGQGATRPAGGGGDRPQPSDGPGSPGGGWAKVGAVADGGWSAIDDVEGSGAAGWRQT